MVKKRGLLAVCFVIIIFLMPYVLAIDPTEYEDGKIKIEIYSDINVEYKIKKVGHAITELNFVPITTWRQGIESLTTTAEKAEIENFGDKIKYEWKRPVDDVLSYRMDAIISTRNDFIKIDKKINFPLESGDLSEYAKEFLLETKYIDSSDELLANKAKELAETERDMYVVVHKIAEWVRNNVKYDLNTLTADIVQPSSWVYRNKVGVCDEVTNLFIAMLRSVGIPARFVSGVVYTNKFERFDAHGWAEVYFPGYGWVPFDVVFAQYGFLDPSHVKLQASKDPSEPAVVYRWSGFNIEPGKLNLEASFEALNNKANGFSDMSLNILKNDVGFGSSVPIEIKLKNTQPYFMPTTIIVTKAPLFFKENVKSVLLEPYEEKVVHWLIKIPVDLEKGYSYISVIEVKDAFGKNVSSELRYGDYPVFTEEEAKSLFGIEEERKVFLKEVEFECSLDKKEYNVGDNIGVNCFIKNIGKRNLKGLRVCLKEDCSFFDYLRINEKVKFKFEFKLAGPISEGTDTIIIKLENSDVFEYKYLNVNIKLKWYEKIQLFFSSLWGAVF